MEIKIDPGAVRVDEVTLIVDTPDAKIYEINMHTKYAELLDVVTGPEGEVILHLTRGEHTIKYDYGRRSEATTVSLVPAGDEGGDWHVISETHSRYSLRVALFRYPERDTPDN
jgi:hypothetical protein